MEQISKKNINNLLGQSLPPSEWFQMTQERVNQFADCTLDHQYIHVDPEKAAASPFGGTIAHGFLSLSLVSYFAEQSLPIIDGLQISINYGFDKIRFISPVPSDSRIRGCLRIVDIKEMKLSQFNLKTEVLIEIEGQEKPAIIAEWLTRQIVA